MKNEIQVIHCVIHHIKSHRIMEKFIPHVAENNSWRRSANNVDRLFYP